MNERGAHREGSAAAFLPHAHPGRRLAVSLPIVTDEDDARVFKLLVADVVDKLEDGVLFCHAHFVVPIDASIALGPGTN